MHEVADLRIETEHEVAGEGLVAFYAVVLAEAAGAIALKRKSAPSNLDCSNLYVASLQRCGSNTNANRKILLETFGRSE